MDREGSGDHTFVLNDSRHKSYPMCEQPRKGTLGWGDNKEFKV